MSGQSVYCPHCQVPIAQAKGQGGQPPRIGDLMVCERCAKPSRYTNEGHLRGMTKADIDALPTESKRMLVSVMMAVVQANSMNFEKLGLN